MTIRDRSSWETLDPFDKASQWIKLAPEIAPQLVQMVRVVADHRREQEAKEAEHRQQQERAQAEHSRQLELEREAHGRIMDRRLWITQLVAMGMNCGLLVLLVILAVRFGKDATVPALTILGAGSGLTAGSYVVGNSIRKSWKNSRLGEPSRILARETAE